MSIASSSKISPSLRKQFCERFGDRARFDEPLAPHVAYGVGGPADVLVFPKTEDELSWISTTAREYALAITTIGTGTNLLVRDGGIRGVTISIRETFRDVQILEKKNGHTLVRCGGGVDKPAFLNWAVERGLGGLVFSAGVPGTIGGGIFMNAGTKYGCYGDILTRLRLFDFETGGREYGRNELHFGYRHQSHITPRTLVAWAEFSLEDSNPVEMRAEVDRIIEERAAKQPLDFPSCGSTFKNPEGFSAGRLVEKVGLKGRSIGGAQISTKHANFILNKNHARASDILDLIQIAKTEVYSKFGVQLECEVVVVGEDPYAQK
ncbi:MAG: UDP-N-acetylmuramate dehydrogenase [Bdellovibrionales bacterium]|nr:UDP-N-acetylmuramate dehydrogenase [Bdellovibrionales bacterium]